MITPSTMSEQLLFSTVRIECTLQDGQISVGTGFLFQYQVDEQKGLPMIITNKHVIEGAITGRFHLHEAEMIDDKTKPSGRFFTVELGQFSNRWIPHPNEDVDLCAMLSNPLLQAAQQLGKTAFIISFHDSLLPTTAMLEDLSAVEDVLMVGYPIGLWDKVNNLPLIRRGITATHPAIDFGGRSEGLIDVACFPGSSGSPVLLMNEGMYRTKKGLVINSAGRTMLLGVLYAGPQWEASGEIVVQEIPTNVQPVPITPVMIHLGYIIKAKEIRTLCEHIQQVLETRSAQ